MRYGSERVDLDILSAGLTPLTDRPCIATIGTFDGLHQGHRAVVAATRAAADEQGCRAVAVTFDPRPETVLRPAEALPDLVPVNERVEALLAAGMDHVVVLRFSMGLAKLPAEQFIGRLRGLMDLRLLCVGADFAFGRNKSVNALAVAAMGLKVRVVPLVAGMDDAAKASSTNIRRAIARGVNRREAAAFA